MLLFVIIALLLCGNWFFTETLVYLPVNLISLLTSLGAWTIVAIGVIFLAWCIGEE